MEKKNEKNSKEVNEMKDNEKAKMDERAKKREKVRNEEINRLQKRLTELDGRKKRVEKEMRRQKDVITREELRHKARLYDLLLNSK